MPSLTNSAEWKALISHHKTISSTFSLKDSFQSDKDRNHKFSLYFNDILFDFSKNLIDDKTLPLLLKLTDIAQLQQKTDAMFNGAIINGTEKRAVLHTALRNRNNRPVLVNGENVMPAVNAELEKMRRFSERIRSGEWKGHTGKAITDIINIGIGGSDLGPRMVCKALAPYAKPDLNTHFVSNVDQAEIADILNKVNPETTLFIIASKTFSTQETMTNALTARTWFLDKMTDTNAIKKHFVAISTHEQRVEKFGISPDNMFSIWDWVGGRFSLWSAVGLSIAIYIGMDRFIELLEGAHEVDLHFRETPYSENIPVIMALIGIWYNNFFKVHTHAILPYDQSLCDFPAHLQQLDMESNGKSVTVDGTAVTYPSGPIIWGQPGTNGQHAFYQLMHQGTQLVPCDFLAPAQSPYHLPEHHDILISNFLAQPEALMQGKTEAEVKADLSETERNDPILVASKIFPGNKPSNSFLFKKLTPKTLGSLIAFYEHKIFVQGVIWDINSFDQMGVELGKVLAKAIQPELRDDSEITSHDGSTNALINHYKKLR